LTNLGILWLGDFKQRSRLNYPLTVQYIVYNENEEKVRKVEWHFNQFNPKEIIALGVVAREKKILGYDLSRILQLKDDDRLRNWINNLIKKEILVTEGKTKGLMYRINPKILSSMKHDLKPSLKTMEEHILRALIIEDLKAHPKSKIAEIHKRMDDLDLKYLRRVVYKMVKNKELNREGENKNMVYFLPNKK